MIKLFIVGILFLESNAFSADNSRLTGDCLDTANQLTTNFRDGYADGSALNFDLNGKLVVIDQSKIVKRFNENGSETITFRTKDLNGEGTYEEAKSVEKTIVLTRDSDGRLLKVSQLYDMPSQIKVRNKLKKSGYNSARFSPYSKSVEGHFSYDGNGCSLNQTVGLEMENEEEKLEQKVYYDKKFCDNIAPTLNQLGSQGADKCANLLAEAQNTFNIRSKELEKDGKVFKQKRNWKALSAKNPKAGFYNIATAIQSCVDHDRFFDGDGNLGMLGIGNYGMLSSRSPFALFRTPEPQSVSPPKSKIIKGSQ